MADERAEKANVGAADPRGETVARVCSASTVFLSCTHRRRSARDPGFVDWYLLLQVGEHAAAEEIRKRYLQLALQLHPDKNGHPKADAAFKLVSEAYACLSDKARRKHFDSERCRSFCTECSKNARSNNTKSNDTGNKNNSHPKSTQRARPHRVLQALREAKRRLEEEARTIESCLRRRETSPGQEFPLFDPSHYLGSPGYPHSRTPQAPRGLWRSRSRNFDTSCRRERWPETPVYDMRAADQATGIKDQRFRF